MNILINIFVIILFTVAIYLLFSKLTTKKYSAPKPKNAKFYYKTAPPNRCGKCTSTYHNNTLCCLDPNNEIACMTSNLDHTNPSPYSKCEEIPA